jgi:hypothetical protein
MVVSIAWPLHLQPVHWKNLDPTIRISKALALLHAASLVLAQGIALALVALQWQLRLQSNVKSAGKRRLVGSRIPFGGQSGVDPAANTRKTKLSFAIMIRFRAAKYVKKSPPWKGRKDPARYLALGLVSASRAKIIVHRIDLASPITQEG